jgi:O-antigen/teichoic acid export membrane protein
MSLPSRSGIAAVAARLAAAGAGFLMIAICARALPIEHFGLFSAAVSYLNVAIVVGMLGHEQLSTRQAALGGQSAPYRENALPGILLAGSVAAVVGACALGAQGNFTRFGWILLCAPVIALTRVEQGLVRGFGMGEIAGTPDGIVRPLVMVLATAVAAYGLALPTAGREWTMVAGWFASAAAGLLAARALRFVAEARRHVAEDDALARLKRVVFMFSKSMYVSTLLSVAINQIPLIAVSALGGKKDIAMYAASDRLSQIIAMMPQAISQARAGRLAKAYEDGGVRDLSSEYMRITRAGWRFGIPVSVLVFALAETFLAVFGPQFADASTALRLLCVATLLTSLAGPLGTALLMTGHSRQNTKCMLVGCAAQVIFSACLIPRLGATGAAIAVLASTVIWLSLLMRQTFISFGALPYAR